ncbi:unnamed protein product [Callosobruchus maculatus]|uniref:Uncharacterized protein n=1 Tax=Callosobruchus maculatus TaxID=64391 RepID=A0A653CTL6_CALMS|nr:unnamed protein product [Callosobruchus maculatus]
MTNKQDIMLTAIEELRLKLKEEDCQNGDIEIEKILRELITELYIKREEVQQLEDDNKQLQLNVSELKKQLDESTRVCKEMRLTLDILKQKAPNGEEQSFEKKVTYAKVQLQYKVMLSDIATLKEKLDLSESERNDLSRKLEVLENKFKHCSSYKDEIMKRDNDIRRQIEDINESLLKLKTDQTTVVELAKQSDLAVEAMVRIEQLSRKVEKLSQERELYQDLYVKTNGQLCMLEESLSQSIDSCDEDTLAKMIFNKWKLSEESYNIQTEQKKNILSKMIETVNDEQSTNEKLIFENEQLKKLNEDLKKDIDEINEKKKKALSRKDAVIQELESKITALTKI